MFYCIFAFKLITYSELSTNTNEPRHEISNNRVSATSKASDHPAHAQSPEYSMSVRLLTEHNLKFLSLKGGCTGSSESIHVKMHIVGNHMSRLK